MLPRRRMSMPCPMLHRSRWWILILAMPSVMWRSADGTSLVWRVLICLTYWSEAPSKAPANTVNGSLNTHCCCVFKTHTRWWHCRSCSIKFLTDINVRVIQNEREDLWIIYEMAQKILTETYSRILWWNREAKKLFILICWYSGPCIWRSSLNCFLPKVKIFGFQK